MEMKINDKFEMRFNQFKDKQIELKNGGEFIIYLFKENKYLNCFLKTRQFTISDGGSYTIDNNIYITKIKKFITDGKSVNLHF